MAQSDMITERLNLENIVLEFRRCVQEAFVKIELYFETQDENSDILVKLWEPNSHI